MSKESLLLSFSYLRRHLPENSFTCCIAKKKKPTKITVHYSLCFKKRDLIYNLAVESDSMLENENCVIL